MPTLTIENVPDALHERLLARAAAHRRSLDAEVVHCLEVATGGSPVDPAEWLAAARIFREGLTGPPPSDAALRAARIRGRA